MIDKAKISENINQDLSKKITSLCNFCKINDVAPPFTTDSPQAIVAYQRLESLNDVVKSVINEKNLNFSVSKGTGKFPKVPWIAITMAGKKVSNSLSVTTCFSRHGTGIVAGLMSPVTYYLNMATVDRISNNPKLILNNVKKTKYDNKFVMPLEILTEEFDSNLYINHLFACVSKMVEIYSDKPNL